MPAGLSRDRSPTEKGYLPTKRRETVRCRGDTLAEDHRCAPAFPRPAPTRARRAPVDGGRTSGGIG